MATRHPVLHVEHRQKRYVVVRRVPPLVGEPEWVVASDGMRAESVGLFFVIADAQEYADWKSSQIKEA
jgi:hypothetical protein